MSRAVQIGRIAVQGLAMVVAGVLWLETLRAGLWGFALFTALELGFFAWTLGHRPLAVTTRPMAWFASLVIALYPLLTPFLVQSYAPSAIRDSISAVLTTIALILEIVSLAALRTAFTQVPEARRIVRAGPYRFVRHPLYTAYLLAFFGLALRVFEPVIWLLFGGFVIAEWIRATAEEEVLERTFGAPYRQYKAATGMFWPRRLLGQKIP